MARPGSEPRPPAPEPGSAHTLRSGVGRTRGGEKLSSVSGLSADYKHSCPTGNALVTFSLSDRTGMTD